MSNPVVSVVVPAFNASATLRQTLESVRWQTFTDWECIVVDDGSSDATPAVAAEFSESDPRIRIIRQTNQGLAGARNTGIAAATGEFIQLLDADDLLLPAKLGRGVDVLRREQAADVWYTEYVLVSRSGRFFQTLPAAIPVDPPLRSFLFRWNREFVIPVHAFLFRTPILRNYPFRSLYGEDVDCWIRMAADGIRFLHHDEVGIIYRISEGSMTSRESRLYSDRLEILRSHRQIAAEFPEEYEEAVHWMKRRIAVGLLMEKNITAGLRALRSEWSFATWRDRLKMAAWAFLMLFLPVRAVVWLRERLAALLRVGPGGWGRYKPWPAPPEVRTLLN